MASQQIHSFTPTMSMSNAGTSYTDVLGGCPEAETGGNAAVAIMPAGGVARDFGFVISAAPGSGKKWTFTVQKKSLLAPAYVNTAAIVTISGSQTSGSFRASDIALAEYDLVRMKIVPSGGPTSASILASTWAFIPTIEGTSVYFGFDEFDSVEPKYASLFRPGPDWAEDGQGGFSAAQCVAAAAGTVTAVYAYGNTVPIFGAGLGKGFTWTTYRNGTAQDGAGGTVDTVLDIDASSQEFIRTRKQFALPCLPGDLFYVRSTRQNDPWTRYLSIGVAFVATTKTQSQWCRNYAPTSTDGTLRYASLLSPETLGGGGADITWFLTEAAIGYRTNIAPTSFVLSDMQLARPDTPPGTGNSDTYRVRNDAINSDVFDTIADDELAGEDLDGSVLLFEGCQPTFSQFSFSVPDSDRIALGLIQDVEAPTARLGVIGPYVWVRWPRRIP